jgi:hypothetical protein
LGGWQVEERPDLDALVAAAVRREVGRMTRRYAPLVTAAIVFALVVALVPTVDSKKDGDVAALGPGAAAASGDGGVAAGRAGTAGDASAVAADATGVASSGGGDAGAAGASAAGTGGGGGGVGAASAGGEAAPVAGGATRGGTECGRGVPQVSWTKYSPPCVPAFAGDNGGATSHGVTKDTITVTFRRGQSAQDTAVYAAAGDAAPAPDPQFVADLRTYIDFFNKHYELYGRRVVLKDFQGQGDYIQEHQGQGSANAAADGVTARELGGFADVTFPLKGSRPFWEALARNKVVAIGPLGFPNSWYQRHAPYWFSAAPTGSQGASFVANVVCRRLSRLPAIFAGDPLYQRTQRVFGLITPQNPEYMEIGDEIAAGMKGCGVNVARRVSYAINVATFQAQATNMAAQLKAAGITTALCFCDPLVPIFLSNAAQSQNWQPEWTEPYYNDPQGRLMNQDQWAHAMTNGATHPPMKDTEADRVWRLASPGANPREQYYDTAYYTVLFLMNALQAAGPNLTPQSLAAGLAKLPPTPRGDVGAWTYGPGKYSPISEVPMAWWNPNATSARDGKRGAWISCEGGTWYPYGNPDAWGAPGNQPKCFGR